MSCLRRRKLAILSVAVSSIVAQGLGICTMLIVRLCPRFRLLMTACSISEETGSDMLKGEHIQAPAASITRLGSM